MSIMIGLGLVVDILFIPLLQEVKGTEMNLLMTTGSIILALHLKHPIEEGILPLHFPENMIPKESMKTENLGGKEAGRLKMIGQKLTGTVPGIGKVCTALGVAAGAEARKGGAGTEARKGAGAEVKE